MLLRLLLLIVEDHFAAFIEDLVAPFTVVLAYMDHAVGSVDPDAIFNPLHPVGVPDTHFPNQRLFTVVEGDVHAVRRLLVVAEIDLSRPAARRLGIAFA